MPDQAARDLMEEFYRNLWEKLSKIEVALRQAQLRMLNHFWLQSRREGK